MMSNEVVQIDEEIQFRRRLNALKGEIIARTVDIEINGDGFLEGLYDNEGRRIERKSDPTPRDETRGKVIPFKRG